MQVTKETWHIHKQCVPGSLSSSPAQEPGNEARTIMCLLIYSSSLNTITLVLRVYLLQVMEAAVMDKMTGMCAYLQMAVVREISIII